MYGQCVVAARIVGNRKLIAARVFLVSGLFYAVVSELAKRPGSDPEDGIKCADRNHADRLLTLPGPGIRNDHGSTNTVAS
jgi:hypothetical protein